MNTARSKSSAARSAVTRLESAINADRRVVAAPRVSSFREFLETQARVRLGRGDYGPYTFSGREPLIEIVETIDAILGSQTGKPLPDATLAIAGGAQFGKTILELNLAAYLTACLFRNTGLYLPDDDLVEGIVDTKFRPDIVEQIDWFAQMVQVGKAVSKTGRAVNRKGAFTVTDGERTAVGMIRGLGKVPTTFSMDVAQLDEVDDINPRMAKFISGRLTASDLRAIFKIGTQRIHSRGMHAAWKDGSQGVVMLICPHCEAECNPEESFPQIVRVAMDGAPAPTDPQLTWTGDFRMPGSTETTATHDPTNLYYLGCPTCSGVLGLQRFEWRHRIPSRIRTRNWSYRISQLSIPAIDLSQIVAHWVRALADAEEMVVFRCDRLALPKSTAQALTPEILDRSRGVGPYDLGIRPPPHVPEAPPLSTRYAGLDMGDRCWFFARDVESPAVKRVCHVERIAAGDVVNRVATIFALHQVGLLMIDERPLVNEARTLALMLNGLQGIIWPHVPEPEKANISFPGGLRWDGPNRRWFGLRCAVVRFDKKSIGAGVQQTLSKFEEGGQTKFIPLIQCNRFETIDRCVQELLTPAENVMEVVSVPGSPSIVRQDPSLLLPRRTPGAPAILETLDDHLIAGSERTKEADGSMGDYVDKCENHLLLSDAYSCLAELIGAVSKPQAFGYTRTSSRSGRRRIVGKHKGALI